MNSPEKAASKTSAQQLGKPSIKQLIGYDKECEMKNMSNFKNLTPCKLASNQLNLENLHHMN